MCPVGSALLLETLARIDEIRPAPQAGDGSYAPMLTKADTVIQWNRPAREILNLIRGLNPFPAARTTENGRILKVYAARAGTLQGAPGTVLATDGGLTVGCADGSVVLTEVQPEGKRRECSAEDFFARGNKTEVGAMLGCTARQLALRVLFEIDQNGAYSSMELKKQLAACGLAEADRAFASELVYGVVKNRTRLDFVIAHSSSIRLKKLSVLDFEYFAHGRLSASAVG